MLLFELFATLGLKSDEFNQGIDAAQAKASGLGTAVGTFGKVAAGAFIAAGGAVVAFAKKSVDVGKAFDASMSQLAATMGMPKEAISDLEAEAERLGRTTQFTASQAAQGMNVLAMAGYDAAQIVGTLPEVLNLAAAGGLDIAQAADYATGIMAGFGLQMDRSGDVVNYLAKLASSAKGDVASFGEGLSTVAGMAKTTGQSIEDMSVALGILGNNNYSASEGGNALARTLRNLYQPSEKAQKTLKALGVSAYDSNGQAKPLRQVLLELNASLGDMNDEAKNQVLSQIFDAATLKSVPALMAGATDGWDKLAGAIESANGAAGEMRDKMQGNLQGDMLQFGSALEGVQITLSKELTPSLRQFVQYGTSALSTLTDAFKNGGLDGMFAALPSVINDGVSMVLDFIPTLMEAATTITGAFVGALFNNIPVIVSGGGEIILKLARSMMQKLPNIIETGETMLHALSNGLWNGIPDMVAGSIRLITGSFKKMRNSLPELVSAGRNVIQSVIHGVEESVPLLVRFVPMMMSDIGQTIIESTGTLMDTGLVIINAISQGVTEAIPFFLENALPLVLDFVTMFREHFGEFVDAGIGLIMNILDGIIASLPALWEYVPQIVSQIAGLINDNAPKLLTAGVSIIIKLVQGVISSIPLILENFGSIMQAVVDVILAINWINLGSQLIDLIKEGVTMLFTVIPEKMAEIGGSAKDAILEVDWWGLGNKIIDTIVAGLDVCYKWIENKLVEIATSAWNAVSEIDWWGLGTDMINGIISGLSAGGKWLKDKMVGLGRDAWQGVKDFFGIESPSKLMRDTVGKMIPLGLAEGIEAETDAVIDAMDRLSELSIGSMDIGDAVNSQRGGFTQTVIINAPTELSPSEIARQTRNATRDMALAMAGV